MHGIDAPVREEKFASFDGTRVTYYVAGSGPKILVLAPGLGTPFVAWKYIIEEFQDRYTLLTWDPRGTYRSDPPSGEEALRVEDHAADLAAIRAREGFDRFVLGGWSMGVQIALEYTHRFPAQVRALVLINGAYEHVLTTAFGLPGVEPLGIALLTGGRRVAGLLRPVAFRILRMELMPKLLHAARLVSNATPLFSQMLAEFSHMDWRVYFRMILRLNEHSAAPYLSGVKVPTLVTVGTHDKMTPEHTGRRMSERIPGAQLFVIHHGTHYAMAEYPEVLNLRLERFLRDLDPELFAR